MNGKVVNWANLVIPSDFEPLWWAKIGKVANEAKLATMSHSEPLRWEKIGKDANQMKLAILSHCEPLRWEKIGKVANWAKLAILSHSEPLLVGKDWQRCKLSKIGHSELFWAPWWEKIEKVVNRCNWPFRVILSHFGGK